ncbi:TPA: type 2 isopentenyl-diphosphate Delta-isomerase [Candidatus Bathyarchaeota archaeon]|nr:type 2 isopentenyl-diphosphate Delta-isomerase [Candidatus Bathyarchaeota archaeon]
MAKGIEGRKLDHLSIALVRDIEASVSPGFDDVTLVHDATPELNREDVDLSIELLNHRLRAPILIEPMTGGVPEALKINASLAEAAEELGLGVGVGSQRAALKDPSLRKTYRIVREKAPTTLVLANIGCSQILGDEGIENAMKVIEMIDADALSIHLNPLQESIQPEGETKFRGVLKAITKITKEVKTPVIVKETGAGISIEAARKLEEADVQIIDVAGLGGTSWASVEYYRAKASSNKTLETLGKTFWNWGIPTVVSLIEVKAATKVKVIASGGVRTGLDAAKSIALGAEAVGLALPLLKPAARGPKMVIERLKIVLEELKTAMFLTGTRNVKALRKVPVIISGKTSEWLSRRGINLDEYARRRLGKI